jgi:hypothetical protein
MTGLTDRGSFELPGSNVPAQDVMQTSSADGCSEPSATDLSKEWQKQLRDLQRLICELLLKNEQLRMEIATSTAIRQELPCELNGRPCERFLSLGS